MSLLSYSLKGQIVPVINQELSLTHENAADLHSMGGGLLVTNKERSAFPSANNSQGQLQTPQSVTVPSSPAGTQWIAGWVDAVRNRNISCPCR